MPPSLIITQSARDAPAAIPLIGAYPAELLRRFDQEDWNSFADWSPGHPRSVFVLVLDGREAVGCGAIRAIQSEPCVAEVKRMYARQDRRGIGTLVLEVLEREARRLGYTERWLETMSANAEAIVFFTRHGYRRRANYVGREEHVCLERNLS